MIILNIFETGDPDFNTLLVSLSDLFTGSDKQLILCFNYNFKEEVTLNKEYRYFNFLKSKTQEFFDETLNSIESYLKLKTNPFAEVCFNSWIDKLDFDVYNSFSKKFSNKSLDVLNITFIITKINKGKEKGCCLSIVESFYDSKGEINYPIGKTEILLSEYRLVE